MASINRRNSYVAALALKLIKDGANEQQVATQITPTLGNFTSAVSSRTLTTVGRVMLLYGPLGDAALFITGTTLARARPYLYGYRGVPAMRAVGGGNHASIRDVFDVIVPLIQGARRRINTINIYGYSAGGVVAELAAKVFNTLGICTVSGITTYGAPKPGLAGCMTTADDNPRIRWMCNDDPVPQLPYASLGGGNAIALVFPGGPPATGIPVHGTRGVTLFKDGSIGKSQDSTGTVDPTFLGTALWLAGLDGGNSGPHSLDTYARRLLLPADEPGHGDQFEIDVRPAQPHGASVPIPYIPATQDVSLPELPSVILRDAGPSWAGQGLQHVPATKENPVSQVFVAPSLKVRTQRSGRIFLVLWDDVIIAQCSFPSKAKTIASSINRTMRMFGKADNVSSASLVAYIQMFLGAAAQGGGLVRPPINVDGQ